MPRKVLYVNTPVYIGGTETSLLALMRHLNSTRHVPVLVTSGEGALANEAAKTSVETHILPVKCILFSDNSA